MRPLHSTLTRLASAAAALLIAATAARAGDTLVFSDGSFGAGLVSQKIQDSNSNASFGSATVPGGPSGVWRMTSHTFGPGDIVVAHADPQYTLDPAVQQICKIDFAADLVHTTASTVGGAVAYRLAIQQGGIWYHGPAINVTSDQWASYVQNGLVPKDFTRVYGSGPDTPDFSCTGAPMVFGFTSANSASSGPFTKVSGIDNWLVTLHLATATWTDSILAATNWNSTLVLDTTAGATFSNVSQPNGDAFNGPYRETTHNYSQGAIVVTHEYGFGQHDPSVEPVYSVDFSFSAEHLTALSVGGAVGVSVAVRQGAVWYIGPTINVFSGSWNPYSQSGVTAGDFTNVSWFGPAHPDFSSSGALLYFGYATSNSVGPGGPVTKVVGVDNWTVRANLLPSCNAPVGTPVCLGADLTVVCPCFPSVPLFPSASRGCPNSIEPRGAMLVAHGTPSIGNDSLVLQGSGMPNSSCLYFQGAVQVYNVFGDGKRCAGGATVRLGTFQNICNASEYPGPYGMSISQKAGLSVPVTRVYQCWYRNPATFCTSATFNLTNAISINWTL